MAFNPVEKRLVDLCRHWNNFRLNPTARLLIWQVPENANRVLQCFFEVQKHESEYSTEDFFVVFNAPFENSIQYSRALKEELAGQYTASIEDLKQQGITADWVFSPDVYADSASGFIQSLRSLGSKYHKNINCLVAVLMPQQVVNDKAYIAWLVRALNDNLPERLRLVVIDSIENPRLDILLEECPELVTVDTPKIDALAVAQETFAQEKTVGPAGIFRNHLMGLVALIEKGSLKQITAKTADAFAFARKQKWSDQEVVLRMLYAGALLKEKQFDRALKTYQDARQSALKTMETNHPAGLQLVLQTWFGEAGAHLAAGDSVSAIGCYDQAADVAAQIPNLILEIEACRMGIFCYGRLSQSDNALVRWTKIVACAQRLKPESRAMTTLPLAAIDTLRVIDPLRLQLMEDIKFHYEERLEKFSEVFEQQIQTLEKATDNTRLRAIEEKHAFERKEAAKEASTELNKTADSGGEQFREIFSQAHELLDENWPLTTLSAVPLPQEDSAS